MIISEEKLKNLKKSWKKLKRLNAIPIDLERILLIRGKSLEFLTDVHRVESLIHELGLNDEGLEEYPGLLYPFCGQGLRIWQYPIQLSPYLVELAGLNIGSYMELGVRHGGTFVATVEYLEKFHPLDYALGIDIIPCPSLEEYKKKNPRCDFLNVNSQSIEFEKKIESFEAIDLVFLDSCHEESHCRKEFHNLKEKTDIFAFHDITSRIYPGIGKVWQEIKNMKEYQCKEYTRQYPNVEGPYMGIGLAIRRDRLCWKH